MRAGRGKGELLSTPGSKILLRKRDLMCWCTFMHWIRRPEGADSGAVMVHTNKWGGRDITVDLNSGCAVSGLSSWYIEPKDRTALIEEATLGKRLSPLRADVLLPRRRNRKKPGLFREKLAVQDKDGL
jgi:hypothetical protein